MMAWHCNIHHEWVSVFGTIFKNGLLHLFEVALFTYLVTSNLFRKAQEKHKNAYQIMPCWAGSSKKLTVDCVALNLSRFLKGHFFVYNNFKSFLTFSSLQEHGICNALNF